MQRVGAMRAAGRDGEIDLDGFGVDAAIDLVLQEVGLGGANPGGEDASGFGEQEALIESPRLRNTPISAALNQLITMEIQYWPRPRSTWQQWDPCKL
jgi:hypothetical protein